MKAEHRKELHTNVLADRMGRFMQGVRKRPRGRTVLIWLLIIVAVVGVIVWFLWRRTIARTESERWIFLHRGALGPVLKDYPETKQGQIARFQEAWILLWDSHEFGRGGLAYLNSYPDESEYPLKYVRAAKEKYELLYEETKDDPILGPEALYNLAIAYEALAIEDIDNLKTAKEMLEELKDNYKESARAHWAKIRLKDYDEVLEVVTERDPDTNKNRPVVRWKNDVPEEDNMLSFYKNFAPKKFMNFDQGP